MIELSISVVIPAYDNARWIGRAIESVLDQSRPADEIFVVDDGSTDQTAEIAEGFGSAVQVIRQSNAGAAAARNTGIGTATGNWIAFLDADDEWEPDKLRLQVEHLQQHPDLEWTTANYFRCLCDESICRPALNRSAKGDVLADYLQTYMQGFTGHTDTMLIRRDLLERTGGFRAEQKRFNDLDLWLRIAYIQPRIGYLARPLAIHHLQAGEHISVQHHQPQICRELISRHLELSSLEGRRDEFKVLGSWLLRRWMRAFLFDSTQAKQVRSMLNEFSCLLSSVYRIRMRLMTTFPKATAFCLGMLSKLNRTFGFRKSVQRRPQKQSAKAR